MNALYTIILYDSFLVQFQRFLLCHAIIWISFDRCRKKKGEGEERQGKARKGKGNGWELTIKKKERSNLVVIFK